jgi:UDP-arabinose 4-epimerase
MAASVLVTGGAGYVGSHACKALAAAGFRPVTYDNLGHGHAEAVRWGPLVVGDLAERDRLVATMREHRVSAVMHFAGLIDVGESMRAPLLYLDGNAALSFTLLDAMVEAGVRPLVFSSSCATYGAPVRLPLDEDHPQAPVSAYGSSKLMVEQALHWVAAAHGLRYAALRYFNAAGADPEGETGEAHHPETHLIPLAFEAALGRRVIEIYGTDYPTPDGTCRRDYVHVSDLAEAHVRALRHLLDGGTSLALNLGTGRAHSVREVIAAVERVTGRAVPIRETGRREGDPPVLVADPSRARALLGWAPARSDLDTIMRTAWAWATRGL